MVNKKIEELYLKGFSYQQIAQRVGLDRETVRTRIRRSDYYEPKKKVSTQESKIMKESHTLNSDGSRIVERVIELTDSQNIDDKMLLKAHGFDPFKWEMTSATNNVWGQKLNEDGEQVTLYQSKIKVKPLSDFIEWEAVKEAIQEDIPPLEKIEGEGLNKSNYLVIPLFDLHFGNSTLIDYWESLSALVSIIRKGYKEILIISGGDILNEDNYNGTTSSGTLLEKSDMTRAWREAFQFYEIIIANALKYSEKLSYMYVEGNHDTYSGHTLQLALEQRFINSLIDFDIEKSVYKARLLGHNFIATTHGHKSRIKNYPQIFATEFSKLWGDPNVVTRECYIGHLHTEWSSCDNGGLMIRRTPTRNKTDKWHRDSGFVTAHKRLMVSEYSETEIKKIYFI